MTPDEAQDATHSPEPAQEAPVVVRELQAARETKWLETLELTGGRFDRASMLAEVMALAAEETFEATSALRQELAQAQAALAEVKALADDLETGARTIGLEMRIPMGLTFARAIRAALAAEPTPAAEPHAEDGAHVARRVKVVDGWIQVVECSCSDTSRPTTHEWARNHFEGTFEDGWKVLEALVQSQKGGAR